MASRQQTIDQMLAGIASMEMGLSDIIHAEAAKIDVALEQRNPQTGLVSMDDLLTVNKSVESMMRKVIMKEMLLSFQLEDVVELDNNPPGQPTDINILPQQAAVAMLAQANMKAVVSPAGAASAVFWASNDESVATVDQDGVVTGVGVGMTHISAKTVNGLEAASSITVFDEEIEPELS